MRRVLLIVAAAVTAASTAACGGGDITVLAQLESAAAGTENGEAVALGSLPARLLPYDRDALFDSLGQAFPEPEPQVPDSIVALQDRVLTVQREWQQAENRWALVRDSLKSLSDEMRGLSQSSGEYLILFREFNDLESEVDGLYERAQQRFQEFTTLQNNLNQQSREIALERRAWADEAFAPVDSIIAARLEAMGREELADTTSSQGVARFRGVKPGQWWVYARFERAYDELYWNVPIEVARGEEQTVRLTEDNAEVRGKM